MKRWGLRVREVVATVLAVAPVFVSSGCAKHHLAPTAPAAQLPPQVIATSPPARSTHVPTDVAIWAQFDRPLDPATVDTRHVFLKVDTRRLPITVSYDAASRRVLIDAGGNLALYSTHTVEFKPGLRAASGDSLGQTYFWQFTTLSVRRARAPYPPDSAIGESPFAELRWEGTEADAGPIVYQLYSGTDSASVASRTAGSTSLTISSYLPAVRWPQGIANYWSVRTTNFGTGESIEGPVWRFDPLPASTPIDSVRVPMGSSLYGYLYSPPPFYRYFQSCNSNIIRVRGDYDNLERWDFSALGPGTRLAGAVLMVTPDPTSFDGQTHGLTVLSVRSVGTLCTNGATPPFELPVADHVLAGAELLTGGRLRLASDPLATYAEAVVRHGLLDATLFRAFSPIDLSVKASPPVLVLYVYRPSAAPVAAARR